VSSGKLRWNSYGKSAVRLAKVTRADGRHSISDLTVSVAFEGDYERVYTSGDNSLVLPTDTMKNTVYAMASQHPVDPIEKFAMTLGAHFLAKNGPASLVQVDIEEHGWKRIKSGDGHHAHAFMGGSDEQRVTRAVMERERTRLDSGLDNLVLLKTTGSGFEGYFRDEYTTLLETSDRVLATAVSARWDFTPGELDFNAIWWDARQAMIEAFADVHSLSVQHTLYEMGERVLDACPQVKEIRLTLPNKHHLLVNLKPFGLDNQSDIFVPTPEPYGLIKGTVTRR
jgi:urate oxidase